MQKIYPFATPEQLDMKVRLCLASFHHLLSTLLGATEFIHRDADYGNQVKVLHASVLQSIEITERTTVYQRFITMITVPVNRRALSMFSPILVPS